MLILLDILTVLALLGGVAFMFVGAVGLWRLPDLYNRMHAASKCITLGISGMLLAAIFHLTAVGVGGEGGTGPGAGAGEMSSAASAAAKAVLVIIFQFVAAPVAAHMLARAAHLDRSPLWEGTLSDELAEDDAAAATGEVTDGPVAADAVGPAAPRDASPDAPRSPA